MNTLKFNQIEFNHIGEQPTSNIKLQEKSITITENGSSEVKPDNGYDGLGKVKVDVNIAGGGGSGDGGSIEYYKIDENFLSSINEENVDIFIMLPSLLNTNDMILPFGMFMNVNTDMTLTEILTSAQGIACFQDIRIRYEGMEATFNDAIEMMGIDISKWQKITEEEFYNLGA